MQLDVAQVLSVAKELGGLGLLALMLWKGIPMLVAALDRNSRILYRIEGKLGITDTDRIPEQKKEML